MKTFETLFFEIEYAPNRRQLIYNDKDNDTDVEQVTLQYMLRFGCFGINRFLN